MLRDYRKFKSNSINNYLSDEEKNQIIELQTKIKELEEKKKQLSKNVTIKVKGNTNRSGNFVRKCFIIDYEYTKEQMAEIFNLKARTNGKYRITFRNSNGYYSEVLSVEKDAEGNFLFYNNSPVIRVRFGTFETKMTVNKFLHLVSINDFTDIKVITCLGGALDVWAGKKMRAPILLQRAHLEWLWRILAEPKRAKRFLSSLPVLFYAAWNENEK